MSLNPELRPFDPSCRRFPNEIPDIVIYAQEAELTPDDYVRREEGTYNVLNGHFLCDTCYIKIGMPVSPTGWKCP